MTCEEIGELMSMALDKPPDSSAHFAFDAHLSSCMACQRLWVSLQQVDRLFRAAPMIAAPAGFASRAVAAAVVQKRRDSVVLGALALLWGALLVIGGLLISVLGISGVVTTLVGLPVVVTDAPSWLPIAGEVLVTLARIGWTVLSVLRDFVAMPLVATLLMGGVGSGLLVLTVLMRTGQRPAPSLL